MNLVKIGGKFVSGGVVVSINHEGIFVLKDGETRFYTKQEVEKEIAIVRATVRRAVEKKLTKELMRKVGEKLLAQAEEG